jgi:hypothetical protein
LLFLLGNRLSAFMHIPNTGLIQRLLYIRLSGAKQGMTQFISIVDGLKFILSFATFSR